MTQRFHTKYMIFYHPQAGICNCLLFFACIQNISKRFGQVFWPKNFREMLAVAQGTDY